MEGRRAWGGGDTQRPLRALPSALGLPLCPHGLCFPFSSNQLNPDCHTRPQGAPSLSPEKRGRGLTRGLPGSSAESCEDARRGFLGVSCVPQAPPESESDVSTTPPGAKVVLPPGSSADPDTPGEFPALPPVTPRRSLNFSPPKPNFDLSKRPQGVHATLSGPAALPGNVGAGLQGSTPQDDTALT